MTGAAAFSLGVVAVASQLIFAVCAPAPGA
jgi:hypothetical protein